MSTPLADFANAKILFFAPGARSSGRDGFKQVAGQAYLVKAFLKRGGKDVADRLGLPAVDGTPLLFSGYGISFAPISEVEAAAFPVIDEENLVFDETGTLPAEVARDSRAKVDVAGFGSFDARFVSINNSFGHEGIGATVRGILGDAIVLEGGVVG